MDAEVTTNKEEIQTIKTKESEITDNLTRPISEADGVDLGCFERDFRNRDGIHAIQLPLMIDRSINKAAGCSSHSLCG